MVMPETVIRRSAQATPSVTSPDAVGEGYYGAGDALSEVHLYSIAAFADEIAPWGTLVKLRDIQLREYLPTESHLISAFSTVAARNAAFSWKLDGGPRQVKRAQDILLHANFGAGWRSFAIRFTLDLLGQDNGAFVEFIREADRPTARVIGIANMDAGRFLGRDTRVWMADGRKVPVLDVVRSKDEGPVLSVGPTGELEAKRITAWHSSQLGERWWMQLRLASPHRAFGRGEGMWLTNDHEVLTPDGYVRAESLTLESRVLTADPEPNSAQMEVLIGTLLGDAGLSRRKRGVSIALGHAVAQREWLDLKVRALEGMGFSPVRGTRFMQTSSLATPALASLYDAFYPSGGTKVVPRELVEQHFSPRMLATWFADDGNRAKGKWGRSKGRIYTYGFPEEDTAWLADLLTRKGYTATTFKRRVTTGPYSGRVHTGIYVTAAGAERLFADVAPFMPACMRHKVTEDTAEFDPTLWDIGHANRYAAAVESIERGLNGEQATAYCIDVEDNHNFVAANTVVHNCWRTGDPRNPVLYRALDGTRHLLPWWRAAAVSEMPSNIERLRGLQYSALTRALEVSRLFRDIHRFQREKMGGRRPQAIHFVNGVAAQKIADALAKQKAWADNQNLYRYLEPLIVEGLKPDNPVSTATIELASLPDNFDALNAWNMYIDGLAMALLIDRQDLAPLTGGNIGTSTQSQVLAQKTRGKGPALFMKLIEDLFNFYGVLGEGVEFSFDEQDLTADQEQATVDKTHAEARNIYVTAGILTPQIVRQQMADSGELQPEYLELMAEEDVTDETTATDESPVENEAEVDAGAVAEAAQSTVPADAGAVYQAGARARKDPAVSAMDETEEDARRRFREALASTRESFARAVRRQVRA